MDSGSPIDITFDFRSDTPLDKDPDTWSPTLSRYHKLLWSKPLPSGAVFDLAYRTAPFYLHHDSYMGEFRLSSDAVVPSFRWLQNIEELTCEQELNEFVATGYTMGGMMIFPANQIQRKWTINQARGCTKKISDRFDLTLECIRRDYIGGASPLGEALARYADFFELFEDFQGYVEFFLLQDLVSIDYTAVNFFSPFDDFNSSALPQSRVAYHDYRARAIDFIAARNQRIQDWSAIHLKANESV